MDLTVELPTQPTDFLLTTTTTTSSYSSSRCHLDHLPLLSSSSKPPTTTNPTPRPVAEDDFEFDFSGQLLHRPTLSAADELFDGGIIRPLKPPPRLQVQHPSATLSPRSPTSKLRGAFSPRNKNNDFDPFEVALECSRRSDFSQRGRPKDPNPRPATRKGLSRSLSPLRVSEFALQQQQEQLKSNNSISGSSTSSSSSSRGYRKWRIKDFLLFRSASEGRATIKKYSVCSALFSSFIDDDSKKIHGDDVRNSSLRSAIGAAEGSISGSSRRRSAHELHYTANRAVSEEMKKKTSLPYKYGLLGCLGFNHSSSCSSGYQQLSRGCGYSFSR